MKHEKIRAPIDRAAIVEQIVETRKYAEVCPDTIGRAADAAIRTSPKRLTDAVHYAKEKLHQWCGAYRDGEVAKLERELESLEVAGGAETAARAIAMEAMRQHASTAERLPDLDGVGALLREASAGASVVLDLCGGANAFALPWIGLDAATKYRAYDIDGRFVTFVAKWLAKTRLGEIELRDVLVSPPNEGDAVAWLLKAAPCLERQEAGSVERLLRAIDARRFVLSFPTRSLSGREKGMTENYGRYAADLAAALGRDSFVHEFDSETFYVIERRSGN